MTGFYNPFSAKPDYGSGIQELLGQLAQMIMIKKMGKDGGQQQLPPPTQPQQRSQGPMNQAVQQAPPTMPPGPPQGSPQAQNQFLSPMGTGKSSQTSTLGTTPVGNSILSPQDIQMLSSQMPPELMQIVLKLLGEGKFPQAGASAGAGAGAMGQASMRR